MVDRTAELDRLAAATRHIGQGRGVDRRGDRRGGHRQDGAPRCVDRGDTDHRAPRAMRRARPSIPRCSQYSTRSSPKTPSWPRPLDGANIGGRPRGRPDRLFAELVRRLDELASSGSVALVLDDVQYADPMTLAFCHTVRRKGRGVWSCSRGARVLRSRRVPTSGSSWGRWRSTRSRGWWARAGRAAARAQRRQSAVPAPTCCCERGRRPPGQCPGRRHQSDPDVSDPMLRPRSAQPPCSASRSTSTCLPRCCARCPRSSSSTTSMRRPRVGSSTIGSLAFSHALVRDALVAGTTPSRRAWLHPRPWSRCRTPQGGRATVARHAWEGGDRVIAARPVSCGRRRRRRRASTPKGPKHYSTMRSPSTTRPRRGSLALGVGAARPILPRGRRGRRRSCRQPWGGWSTGGGRMGRVLPARLHTVWSATPTRAPPGPPTMRFGRAVSSSAAGCAIRPAIWPAPRPTLTRRWTSAPAERPGTGPGLAERCAKPPDPPRKRSTWPTRPPPPGRDRPSVRAAPWRLRQPLTDWPTRAVWVRR